MAIVKAIDSRYSRSRPSYGIYSHCCQVRQICKLKYLHHATVSILVICGVMFSEQNVGCEIKLEWASSSLRAQMQFYHSTNLKHRNLVETPVQASLHLRSQGLGMGHIAPLRIYGIRTSCLHTNSHLGML